MFDRKEKNHTEQNKLMTFILSNSVLRETEKKLVFDYRYINFLQLCSCSFKAILIITQNIFFFLFVFFIMHWNYEEVFSIHQIQVVCRNTI